MNETFPLPQISEFINELGKMFSIGKKGILNPLGIMHTPYNFLL